MLQKISFLHRYIVHFFHAKNTKGHGIHSPYLYRFTQNAIYEKYPFYVFSKIERLRENLRYDERTLRLNDFGTGSKSEARVMDIAKTSLKSPAWAQLLYRIVHFTKAQTVLELGASLGLTTAYLASAGTNIKCTCCEGSAQVAEIARENFEKLEIKNIQVVVGNIDDTLPETLAGTGTLDVVFFDANHRKEPTLRYFSQCLEHIQKYSVFIFDDIHWSAEMEEAWNVIRKHDKVTATIDLFEMGIVFFNKDFPKKTYKMNLYK